mmetsp:Transcript_35813/g.82197  ORF Transcript_35813/g.82197 Transcript_35813/m.82197 type:complete len:433 (+) Transcript_35813:108-1406(+)
MVRATELPEECWLRIFSHLDASDLSGCAACLCAACRTLAGKPQLWISLLFSDFCISVSQRVVLRAWLAMHQHFHPRDLYIYKRREHRLDLDVARTEQQQRGKQVREQDRKQRQVRMLNFFLVRVMHLFLCGGLLCSSILLWLKLDGRIHWSFYSIFVPFFVFEAFLLVCACAAFTLYFMRSSGSWTFYWNRMRGALRWLILYTSPLESAAMLILSMSTLPLLAAALEGDARPPKPCPRFALPFAAFWLSSLLFVGSLLRRRAFSVACGISFALLWAPVVISSVLLFLRLSILPTLSVDVIFAPSLTVTTLSLLFVGTLVIASFGLGCRGNRDWTEYATVTLLALLTLLLPLLLFQLGILSYVRGHSSTNAVFLPWITWLSGLTLGAMWHVCLPLAAHPVVPPFDHLMRPWRQHQADFDAQSDMELLLPAGFV